MKVYLALAYFVAFVHGLVVIGTVTAAVLILLGRPPKSRWLMLLFLCAIGVMGLYFLVFGTCPLTDAEKFLRARGDPASVYEEGFIEHYLSRVGIPTHEDCVFWGGVLLFSGACGRLFWQEVKRRRTASQ